MFKRKKILFFILLPLIVACDNYIIDTKQSDSFIKYYGSRLKDFGYDVKQTSDGGYIVAGVLSVPDSGTNICLIYTDKFGNSKNIKTYGGVYDDNLSGMLLLPDSGIVMIGSTQTNRSGNKDIYVIRTNNTGEVIWERKYGQSNNDEGRGIILEHGQSLVMVGYSEKTGYMPDKDIWMYKIDLNGNGIWGNQRILDYSGDNEGIDIAALNGGYIVMGTTIGAFGHLVDPGKYSIFVFETDNQGITPSPFTFISGSESYHGIMIGTSPEGYYYVLGTADNAQGKTDILLAKLNLSLDVFSGWPIFINMHNSVIGNSFIFSEDKLHIFGTNTKTTGLSSMILYSADFEGNVIENNEYDFFKEIHGLGFSLTSDGGYVLTGGSDETDSEIVLIKTKQGGAF